MLPARPSIAAHRPGPRAGVLLLGLILLLAGGACTPPHDGAGEAATEVPTYTIEQFLDVTGMVGLSVSPDGSKVLVSSDASGIYNAYAVPTDGGPHEQLTTSTDDAVFALSYFPDDERFVFSRDEGGNELTHIYVRETDGTVRDLTPGEELKASFEGFSGDEASFYVATNERDSRYFDIYEVEADGYARQLVFEDEVGYDLADVSPDGRYLAFNKPRTTYDSDIYLYDRESGTMEHLTPHEEPIAFEAEAFSPDGESLYYLSDEGYEFQYLVRHDLATGTAEEVLRPDWDVSYATFSRGDSRLVVGINQDGRTRLRLFDAETLEEEPLPELPQAEIESVVFSRDDALMAFYADSSRIPRNLYVQELPGGAPRQLTETLTAEIDPKALVEAKVVRFDSYDGTEIPGLLYTPHTASPATPGPAIVWVHGGPGGQSRVGYNPLIQYLVNHGYVVYAINNRGSSGYGKTFYRMDDKKHGDADLGDCVASKEMLVDTGYVDPERIAIAGGSYGGYMVLAALAFRPEEFAVGVDFFGISNWLRTLESIPPWWQSFREALYQEIGHPEEDREYLESISPLFFAEEITRPLMVLQGANDPRVLQAESDTIVEAVRANGVPVEYVVFEDEGHGFVKRDNRAEGYRRFREFLDRHLKRPGTAAGG